MTEAEAREEKTAAKRPEQSLLLPYYLPLVFPQEGLVRVVLEVPYV